MIATWQILVVFIVVVLSLIIPLYFSYQKDKKAQKEELNKIKLYGERINEMTRGKKIRN